jgi:lysophospholipase L1-like esterase
MPDRPVVEDQTKPGIRVHGGIVQSPRTALLSRPAVAALTALALAALVQLAPGMERVRLLTRPPPPPARAAPPMQAPVLELGEATLEQESEQLEQLAQPEHVELSKRARGPIAEKDDGFVLPDLDAKEPPVPIEDSSGRALDGFYRALAATARKEPEAVTRVVHFGDSIVVSDLVSGTLRRKLQKHFGDAGHGFVLLASPWPGYFHNDVYRWASSGWKVSRIVGPLAQDGLYGLGGVSFKAPPGARARFGTAKKGRYGRNVSRFVVSYLEHPSGGELAINIDGTPHSVVSTASPSKRSGFAEIRVPDGEHELELVSGQGGMTRAFGVVLERDVPGVVVDAVGIQGARIRFIDKQDDAHWSEQLRARKPALIMYQFGANESADGFAYPMAEYHRTMKDVLDQGRRALPEAGCLVIGAMDRAHKRDDLLVSMEVIVAIVKEQRRAAGDVGCAFFDTHRAMGGVGSMASWVRKGLGQADLTHPSGLGAEVLATWLYRALMQGYREFEERAR